MFSSLRRICSAASPMLRVTTTLKLLITQLSEGTRKKITRRNCGEVDVEKELYKSGPGFRIRPGYRNGPSCRLVLWKNSRSAQNTALSVIILRRNWIFVSAPPTTPGHRYLCAFELQTPSKFEESCLMLIER